MNARFDVKAQNPAKNRRAPSLLPALAFAVLGAFGAGGGCSQKGGTNTTITFRAVLVEPRAGSTNVPCEDTIRVTFNKAIDTTAVYDVDRPRYFKASIQPGAIFDSLGVFLSNDDRTLNLPFTFAPNTNYTFNFTLARSQDGKELETSAQTTFQTATSGALGCP